MQRRTELPTKKCRKSCPACWAKLLRAKNVIRTSIREKKSYACNELHGVGVGELKFDKPLKDTNLDGELIDQGTDQDHQRKRVSQFLAYNPRRDLDTRPWWLPGKSWLSSLSSLNNHKACNLIKSKASPMTNVPYPSKCRNPPSPTWLAARQLNASDRRNKASMAHFMAENWKHVRSTNFCWDTRPVNKQNLHENGAFTRTTSCRTDPLIRHHIIYWLLLANRGKH